MVGLYGELKNDAEDAFGDDKWWGVQAGATIDLFGFKLGGSVGHDEVGETERDFFTAGIGFGFGPVNTSITYGQIFDTNYDFDEATGFGDDAYNLVFSADYRDRAGPGAGGRREQVRQRQRRATIRHRRQGLDRGGQRPPGVLIHVAISRRGGGAMPRRFALSSANSVLFDDTRPVQESLSGIGGGCECVSPCGDKRVTGGAGAAAEPRVDQS